MQTNSGLPDPRNAKIVRVVSEAEPSEIHLCRRGTPVHSETMDSIADTIRI